MAFNDDNVETFVYWQSDSITINLYAELENVSSEYTVFFCHPNALTVLMIQYELKIFSYFLDTKTQYSMMSTDKRVASNVDEFITVGCF